MSSQTNDSRHFNSVERALQQDATSNRQYCCQPLRNALREARKETDDEKNQFVTEFIDTLRQLQPRFVFAQYDMGSPESEILYLMTNKQDFTPLTNMGLYKALECIDYQMEMEYIGGPDKLSPKEAEALRLLKECINEMAKHICRGLHAYEREEWTIKD